MFYSISFAICKIAVPIFLMVSGTLILKQEKFELKQSIKHIIRILIPLIGLSAYIEFIRI